jgi:hypothetical protein
VLRASNLLTWRAISRVEQGLRGDEVEAVESLLVAGIERRDQRMCLGAASVSLPKLSKRKRCAQFPSQGGLIAGYFERAQQTRFRLGAATAQPQDPPLDAEHVGQVEGFAAITNLGDGPVDGAQRFLELIPREARPSARTVANTVVMIRCRNWYSVA